MPHHLSSHAGRLPWRAGPVYGDVQDKRAAMARVSALLYASGASLGLLSLALPGDPGRNSVAILTTALAAYAITAVPLIGSDRLPLWAFQLLTAVGTGLISIGLVFGGQNAHVYGLLYFWVIIYASYFFSGRATVLHLALVGAAYAGVLLVRTTPGLTSFSWVITVGTLAIAAALILLLTSRLAAVVDDLVASEAAARDSGERLRAMIEAAPVAIIELDTDGRVCTWSGAAQRIFGWPADQVLGRSLPLDLDPNALPTPDADAHPFGSVPHVESGARRGDGERIDITVSTAPIIDQAGTRTGVMMIAADMSEQKQLEEQLRHAQKMEAVGRLAGGIAHDFNNILLVVRSYAWLIAERVSEADLEQRADLAEIERAVDRAASLTRQLLTFSQKHVGLVTVVELNALIAGMEGMLRPLIGEDVELVIDSDGLPAPVMADGAQLEQVIVNLAVNAREAMPEGGKLTITIRAKREAVPDRSPRRAGTSRAGDVILTVADTGVGIAPDQQPLIFDPFFTTKKHSGGSGLGLSIVYGIIDSTGGRIDVASEPGRGTTFTVRLPRAQRQPPSPRRHPVAGSAIRGSETLLLVEDEHAVREPLRRALVAHGYTVLAASSGHEALRLAQRHPKSIDLLVTDVVMPAMSGPELVKRLAPRRPDLRVLYMSGYVERSLELIDGSSAAPPVGPGDANEPSPTATAGFVQKPFTPDALAAKVRALLDETDPANVRLPKAS
jgi:two-component system, cell cycle sensor histidine kinase and response regulator CckA